MGCQKWLLPKHVLTFFSLISDSLGGALCPVLIYPKLFWNKKTVSRHLDLTFRCLFYDSLTKGDSNIYHMCTIEEIVNRYSCNKITKT